jgi:hypothetical protein
VLLVTHELGFEDLESDWAISMGYVLSRRLRAPQTAILVA